MNITYSFVLVSSFMFSSALIAGEHEAPSHKMIEQAFSKCEASRSLEGGIYGKGPFKRFGPKESLCSENEWIRITQKEFKRLAIQWHGYDWSNDKNMPFWSNNK